jgi:hypothetical protein
MIIYMNYRKVVCIVDISGYKSLKWYQEVVRLQET